MGHQIEQSADQSQAAFVSARKSAWHQLGTVIEDDTLTAEQVLKLAHLADWDLQKTPITAQVGDLAVPVNGKFAMTRVNPFTGEREIVGGSDATGAIVGNSYVPTQNEECVDLLNALVDESEGKFDTAGSLRDGRNVFVTMKLPKTMLIGGVDEVDVNIALLDSKDGTSSLTLLVTPIRVVCANTEAAALNNFRSKHNIWHTKSSRGNIAAAREGLKLTWAYAEAFEAEAEKMIQQTMTEAQFVKKVRQIWPVVKDESKARAATTQKNREVELLRLFLDADTQSKISMTNWAGYNAITEYVDHFSAVSSKKNAADTRALRVITNHAPTQTKELAYKLLKV